MARLTVEGPTLRVALSALERLGAFVARDPEVPLAAVREVRATDAPWSELRGIRAPGTGFPGLIALGTRRFDGQRDFVAVYRRGPAVVVDCEGAGFQRLVVSSTTAPADAAAIVRAAGLEP